MNFTVEKLARVARVFSAKALALNTPRPSALVLAWLVSPLVVGCMHSPDFAAWVLARQSKVRSAVPCAGGLYRRPTTCLHSSSSRNLTP